MKTILITIGLLAIVFALVMVIILLLTNLGAYFTKIGKGTTVFINRGDDLHAVLPNIGGFRMSTAEDLGGRHWLIPTQNEEERMRAFFHKSLTRTVWFQKWLWNTFGVRFISWVWPHTHKHVFDIRSKKRLLEGSETEEGATLKSRVVDSLTTGGTIVDSLLFLIPRPVYLDGIQLAGDNSRINLLLQPIWQQVIPSLPVYYFKGDFFTQLDAAIEAAMVDFFGTHQVAVYTSEGKEGQFAHDTYTPPKDNEEKSGEEKYKPSHLTYSHWLKLTKAGEESPIEQQLYPLNLNQKYLDLLTKKVNATGEVDELLKYIKKLTHGKLAGEKISEKVANMVQGGIIPRFGFALVSFKVVDWEPHKDTAKLAQALLAKETSFHEAAGIREEAFGVRDAIEARSEGESTRYHRLVDALIEKGVTADVAAGVVETQLRTENIRDGKVTTYVEGGGSTSVLVDGR